MKIDKSDKKTPASPFGSELEPLAGGDVLMKPVTEMNVPERAQAHVILKFLEKRIKDRLDQLREPLLADARTHGAPVLDTNEKPTGSLKLYVEGNTVYDKLSTSKEPDYQKMTDLLVKKSLPIETLYDKVPTYVYNPSKAEKAIENGVLKKKEIEDLKKVTHSLVVDAATELEAMLSEASKAYALPGKSK